mgnify:CR=1 FL=1
MKIVRTKTKATGGVTEQEKLALKAHADKWIANALSTEPVDPQLAAKSVKSLYAAAGLKEPRVIVVPSPKIMAFAGVLSACILQFRKDGTTATSAATSAATRAATSAATRAATSAATYAATHAATRAATHAATRAATYEATYEATRAAIRAATSAATRAATDAATDAATRAATDAATHAATYEAAIANPSNWFYDICVEYVGPKNAQSVIDALPRWSNMLNAGNMGSAWICYLSASREVLGLDLPAYEKFKAYEDVAKTCGYNVQHTEFCMVSDRPEILKLDAENRPHCENGPSHRWRDGWSLYYWHGVSVPVEWIEDKPSLTADIALSQDNVELRRAACEIIGWARILKDLQARTIDVDDDAEIGTLLEVDLPDSPKERFIFVKCATGRQFALPVPKTCKTALEANAWTYGLDGYTYRPEVRT